MNEDIIKMARECGLHLGGPPQVEQEDGLLPERLRFLAGECWSLNQLDREFILVPNTLLEAAAAIEEKNKIIQQLLQEQKELRIRPAHEHPRSVNPPSQPHNALDQPKEKS